MPKVKRKHDGEPFEAMFKRFKKAVEQNNTMAEWRKREYFEKPSDRKKREKAAAIKRWQRQKAEMEPEQTPVSKRK